MWDKRIYFKVGLRPLGTWPSLLLLLLLLTGCSSANFGPWQGKDVRPRPVVVSQADLAMFNDAISLVESLRYEAAAGKFRQVFDNFVFAGDRSRAAESLFWLGFCREKQQQVAEAKAIYLRVAEEYSETRAAQQSDRRLSRLSGKLDL